jgi:hypothetical protein
MFNLPPIKPTFLEGIENIPLSRSEQLIYWVIVLTPLWWLLGIQPLFYPAVVIALLVMHFDLDLLVRKQLPACAWAWLFMAIAMIWTAILGLNEMGFSVMTVAATMVTFFKSYFLIFACLALPFWSQVRTKVITRAVSWLAMGYLIAIGIEILMLFTGIGGDGYMPPLAKLIPGDKSSLRVFFAVHSSFLGLPIPRTVLYTPDPPILGVCSILCFLICLNEPNRRLRQLALAGCVVALIMSASRSALVCLPLALILGICFRSGVFRQISLWLTSLALLFCSILRLTIDELFQKPVEAFNQARASSSSERSLVVQKTLEAWRESPWIGWGVVRGKAHLYEDSYLALGSFSTYAAVLYLHGIIGFIALITAMILTLFAVYIPAIQGNIPCKWAFAGLLSLYILCNATPLSWMAVYLWFFFSWLGAVLYETQQNKAVLSSWEQLSEWSLD